MTACAACGAAMLHADLCSSDPTPPRCGTCAHALSHGVCPQCEPRKFSATCEPRVMLEAEMTTYEAALLSLLATTPACRGEAPLDALRHILECVATGVERPGSWEREKVLAFFGDSWVGSVVVDPRSAGFGGRCYRVMVPRPLSRRDAAP